MDKRQWRAQLGAARRQRDAAEIARARELIAGHLRAQFATECRAGSLICLYLPLASEPLSPRLPRLLLMDGFRVAAPISRPGAPLDWCELEGYDEHSGATAAVTGPLGVQEPTGPRLGAHAICDAAVVLVPALAVDASGTRLGRGGGFYDRSLALLRDVSYVNRPRLIAVVFDDEVLPDSTFLPWERHDVRVDAVVSPRAGIRTVGRH